MKIDGEFRIKAPREQVWEVFMDPAKLGGSVPGCEEIKLISPTRYEANMTVKVQFMTIKFKATGELQEAVEGEQLNVEMVGKPFALAGLFKSKLAINLSSVSEKETEVTYLMDLQMTGRLASLGEILMKGTIEKSAQEFAENIQSVFSIT